MEYLKTIMEMHQTGNINVLGEHKEAIYNKGDLVYSDSRKSEGRVQGSFVYEDIMKYAVELETEGIKIVGHLYIIDEDDLTYLQ